MLKLKFHGIYQQDDRDLREEHRCQKLTPPISLWFAYGFRAGVCQPLRAHSGGPVAVGMGSGGSRRSLSGLLEGRASVCPPDNTKRERIKNNPAQRTKELDSHGRARL